MTKKYSRNSLFVLKEHLEQNKFGKYGKNSKKQ